MEEQRVGSMNGVCMCRQVSRVGMLGFGKELFLGTNVFNGTVFLNGFTHFSHSVQIGLTTQFFIHLCTLGTIGLTTQSIIFQLPFWGHIQQQHFSCKDT